MSHDNQVPLAMGRWGKKYYALSTGTCCRNFIFRTLLFLFCSQTREVTDKFTVEVEIDRRCYEELLDERKNMELKYEERIAQLQDQQAEVGSNSHEKIPLTRAFLGYSSSRERLVSF